MQIRNKAINHLKNVLNVAEFEHLSDEEFFSNSEMQTVLVNAEITEEN